MSHDDPSPAATTSALDPPLERLAGELEASLGDRLRSLVLYGGVARGEYEPRSSNVNLMILLREVTAEALDLLGPPLMRAERELPLAYMVLTKDDLRGSTDVFPIKFRGIQREYRILRGEDLLADLEIAPRHLRLRCEQELRNLVLRLQRVYVEQSAHADFLQRTLTRSYGSVLGCLQVLVELKAGGTSPEGSAATLEAAEALGLDLAPLRRVRELRRAGKALRGDELKTLYGAFLECVRAAAGLVDELEA